MLCDLFDWLRLPHGEKYGVYGRKRGSSSIVEDVNAGLNGRVHSTSTRPCITANYAATLQRTILPRMLLVSLSCHYSPQSRDRRPHPISHLAFALAFPNRGWYSIGTHQSDRPSTSIMADNTMLSFCSTFAEASCSGPPSQQPTRSESMELETPYTRSHSCTRGSVLQPTWPPWWKTPRIAEMRSWR